MKSLGFISSGVLLLLLGAFAPTYAGQGQQEQGAKPEKQQQARGQEKQQQKQQARGQEKQQQKQQQKQQARGQEKQQQKQQAKGQEKQQQKQQARGQEKQQQKQQARGQENQQQKQQQRAEGQREERHQQQQRQQQARRPSEQGQHGHAEEHRAVWKEHRAHNWQSEHRDWRERGGYNGYRIPEDRYRGHFGPGHWFRVYRYPVEVYGGYPRFQYGGFWFGFMDPWPEYWSENWYDNDDVYIVYTEDGYYLYNRRHPRDRIAITVYVR